MDTHVHRGAFVARLSSIFWMTKHLSYLVSEIQTDGQTRS